MLIIQYDAKYGVPIRDGDAEQYAFELVRRANENPDEQTALMVANENIINAVRIAVKRGYIAPENVQVHFITHPTRHDTNAHVLRMDRNGNFSEWPDGFLDFNDRYIAELIDWNAPDSGSPRIV